MARRTPAQPVGGPVENPSVEPSGEPVELDAIAALLGAIDDPAGYEAEVYELDNGKRHMLLRAGITDFDIWQFAEKYGGGDYELRTRDVVTKGFGPSRRFSVSKRVPRRDALQPAPAQPTPAADSMRDVLPMMLGLIQAQSQQTTAILTALIGRPQSEPPIKLGDVAALITATRSDKPAGDMAGLVAAVKELHTLSGGMGGAAGASDEIELAKAFAPVLGELMKPRTPQPQPIKLSHGGAGGGALPPAPPLPAAPQPATAPTPAMPAALEQQPTGPLNAAMDTIAAIVLRVGLDNNGILDSSAVARIGHQTMDALDIDALDALLATVPAGDLPREIVGSTPLIAREQMAQQAEALRTLEVWLRAQVEDHFNDDTAAADPAAQQETTAHAQP